MMYDYYHAVQKGTTVFCALPVKMLTSASETAAANARYLRYPIIIILVIYQSTHFYLHLTIIWI